MVADHEADMLQMRNDIQLMKNELQQTEAWLNEVQNAQGRQQQVLTETGLDRLQVMMWNGFREAFPEWESISDERVQASLSLA